MPTVDYQKQYKKIELISLMDVVFILLIFFMITSIFAFQSGEVRYIESKKRFSIPELASGDGNGTLTEANLLIQLYMDDNRVKYQLRHKELNDVATSPEKEDYRTLIWKKNAWPEVVRNAQVRYYNQANLTFSDIEQRVKQLKNKNEFPNIRGNPKIVVRAERDVPYSRVLELVDLFEQEEINFVTLSTGELETLHEGD